MREIALHPDMLSMMHGLLFRFIVPGAAVYLLARLVIARLFTSHEDRHAKRVALCFCCTVSLMVTAYAAFAAYLYGEVMLDYAIPVFTGLLCIIDAVQFVRTFRKDRHREVDLSDAKALQKMAQAGRSPE
jgi:hypothetical protein